MSHAYEAGAPLGASLILLSSAAVHLREEGLSCHVTLCARVFNVQPGLVLSRLRVARTTHIILVLARPTGGLYSV